MVRGWGARQQVDEPYRRFQVGVAPVEPVELDDIGATGVGEVELPTPGAGRVRLPQFIQAGRIAAATVTLALWGGFIRVARLP